MHLYLTGYRGSGKSTVAAALSLEMGVPAIDLDQQIVQSAGKPIAEIFAQEGESTFRDLESAALAALPADPAVIALGGGAILRPHNRRQIGERGCCVWLVAQPATLAERIMADQQAGAARPSLTGRPPVDEVAEVLRQREPLYRQVADHQVSVDQRPLDEVVEDILFWLDQYLEKLAANSP